MKIALKSLKSGFSLPELGLGTWMMGGAMQQDPQNDDTRDLEAIEGAIQEGILHIDTAEKYAEGYTETLIGKVLAHHDRTKLILTSKVAEANQTYDGMARAIENSLKRLNTHYVDLYLLHGPTKEIPIQETMRGMDHLVKSGLVKHMGVSNFSVAQFEKAQQLTPYKIVANQLHYNMLVREVEHKKILTFCQNNDVMLIAWRPLEKGIFTQVHDKILQSVMKKYDKTLIQLAINWLVSQQNVVTISMTRNKTHLKENLGGIGWYMDPNDIELIRTAFPHQLNTSPAVPIHDWVWE